MNRSLKKIILIAVALLLAAVIVIRVIDIIKKDNALHYTSKGYGTEENLAAFMDSPLGDIAKQIRNMREPYRPLELTAPDVPFIYQLSEKTTMPRPFLVVRVDQEGNWQVAGGSEEKFSPDGIRTLAVCLTYERYQSYVRSGNRFTGSSEGAHIVLYDLNRHTYRELESAPKEFPKSADTTPHYTKANSTLTRDVAEALTPPFTLSGTGEITAGALNGREYDGYLFPENVTAITFLTVSNEVESLSLPESIVSIKTGVLPDRLLLIVVPGSYGEAFACENGFRYRYPGDAANTQRFRFGDSEWTLMPRYMLPPEGVSIDGELVKRIRSYLSRNSYRQYPLVPKDSAAAAAFAEAGLLFWTGTPENAQITVKTETAPVLISFDLTNDRILEARLPADYMQQICFEADPPTFNDITFQNELTVLRNWFPKAENWYRYRARLMPLYRVHEGSPAAKALANTKDESFFIEETGVLYITERYKRSKFDTLLPDELLADVKAVCFADESDYPNQAAALRARGIPFLP